MAKKKKKKIFNGRDYLILKLISGETKAGIRSDRRKKANKERCRPKVNDEE